MRSSVEIYDLETGDTKVVLDSPNMLEAPNWARDGAGLIVNGEGRLYRLDLRTAELTQIDTGPLHKLNNDHGPSPDGAFMAVSDKVETGKACIYVLPAAGGTPTRITQNVPSWWHAWTPDSANLIYTAVRDETFGIYMIPADGGAERRVIGGPHHYDGPDITPDGQWIWFNSERGDLPSSLWRVRPDGSDPQQMTHGARVDWFPHPSPDGQHVVYLSYPEGTEGHPFGREVELRLIPIEGGEPKTLVRLFGGQGTLNVPCWAPDGRRFVFVRYFRESEAVVATEPSV
ncbi:Tol biopolymer transport system component [Sagittula marina]|uniref:Tol biopolymer transport system component n=1 Tax=Sagittula marina TaxID=943940 RepID=A0A7W6DMH1_9RHOB|nr:PD40 domain-containing protein [Sagittula marina]MBB3985269.1 Tol biopolymer transport system component [Sagittula marina]